NSTPNWVVVFVRRATLPSSVSMTMATKMATAASVNRDSALRRSARKPQKRLPVVSRLGSRKIPRRGCWRSFCQRRCRGPRPPSLLTCRLLMSFPSSPLETSSWQERHDRLPPTHPITHPDLDLARAGHEEIGPRAEADQSVALASFDLVARPHPAHDPSGEH